MLQEAEASALAKQNKLDARAAAAEEAAMQAAAAAAAAAANEGNQDMTRSPSFSCQSYELFVGQEKGHDDNNKEMSTRSDGLDSVSEQRRVPTNPTKMRKVSAVSVLINHEFCLILDERENLFQIPIEVRQRKIMTIIVFGLYVYLIGGRKTFDGMQCLHFA